jgi:ATP-dependent DNA helicase RecQ
LRPNEYKGLMLTERGAGILRGHEHVTIRPDRMEVRSAKPRPKILALPEEVDRELYERLRTLRRELAEENGVPPYVIFSDKTLRELAAHRPTNREEMLAIHGIGEVKFERYGEVFLDLLLS